MILFELFYLCFRTSLLSFAGVYGALPEYSRLFVAERGWLTPAQLTESYMIGQVAPGPNMVLGVMIGYRVAGWGGACAAFVGTYAPPVMLTCAVYALFARYRNIEWVRRVELALRPLVIGLMAGAAVTILRGQAAGHGTWPTLIVAAVAGGVYVRRLVGPFALLVGSGVLFWALSAAFALLAAKGG